MSKNIIFCADGTWSGPNNPDKDADHVPDVTNVLKLFLDLAGDDNPSHWKLAKEQERSFSETGSIKQIAKYIDGVGDSDNIFTQAIGGIFGAGLITRIVRGYTFISRNYQAGDRIYLVGFSRGAYTVRALAGMIATQGLLNNEKYDLRNNNEQAYKLASAAWRGYQDPAQNGNALWREILSDLPGYFSATLSNDDFTPVENIEAVAVWDTVGALGIPLYTLNEDRRIDPFKFANTQLHHKIKNGFHAVAVDEQRVDYCPTLWDDRNGIVQTLFPGAHADVGGGYPKSESQLSDAALRWMITKLRGQGLIFNDKDSMFKPAPNPLGVQHQPWNEMPFKVLIRAARSFPIQTLRLHQSILDRLAAGNVPTESEGVARYTPPNLKDYVGASGHPKAKITIETD